MCAFVFVFVIERACVPACVRVCARTLVCVRARTRVCARQHVGACFFRARARECLCVAAV